MTSVRTPGPRTGSAFELARSEGRAALVGYLPAGFPDVPGAIEALRTMVDSGCDVIEIGLPYSDPVMDGPTIQDAAQLALEGGFRASDVIRTVEAVAATGTPTLVMTYWNPVAQYGRARGADGDGGVERFARDLANAGGAGLITPDLTPDSAEEWIAAADAHDLDKVFLVAPSAPPRSGSGTPPRPAVASSTRPPSWGSPAPAPPPRTSPAPWSNGPAQ